MAMIAADLSITSIALFGLVLVASKFTFTSLKPCCNERAAIVDLSLMTDFVRPMFRSIFTPRMDWSQSVTNATT